MTTWMDAAGNIFGRLEGKKKDAPCLMLGSHFDTVTKGGRFDGLAGIAAALEIVTCIRENEIMFEYPIEIAALANEEACQFKGGVMGSMQWQEYFHWTMPKRLLMRKAIVYMMPW